MFVISRPGEQGSPEGYLGPCSIKIAKGSGVASFAIQYIKIWINILFLIVVI